MCPPLEQGNAIHHTCFRRNRSIKGIDDLPEDTMGSGGTWKSLWVP